MDRRCSAGMPHVRRRRFGCRTPCTILSAIATSLLLLAALVFGEGTTFAHALVPPGFPGSRVRKSKRFTPSRTLFSRLTGQPVVLEMTAAAPAANAPLTIAVAARALIVRAASLPQPSRLFLVHLRREVA